MTARARSASTQVVASLTWLAALAAAGLLVAIAALSVTGRTVSGEGGLSGLWPLSWVGLPIVGAVVATRRRREPFGWMLLGVGLGMSVGLGGQEYAWRALPSAAGVAWVSQVAFEAALTLVVFVLLLFPTGRVQGRMRPLAWAGACTFGLTVAAYAVRSRIELGNGATIPNPLHAGYAAAVADAVIPKLGVADVAFAVAVMANAIWRFRRSTGVERLQLRWFAWALAPFPVLMAAAILLPWEGMADPLVIAAFLTAGNGVSVAIGIALMRYRLYDIDRLVSRTLAYAALTVVLALLYATAALALGTVARGSSITVAAATLAVAAAFRPIRGRVQRAVDRRFNRVRYDAQQTVDAFARRVSSEVGLDGLAASLSTAIRTSLSPSACSVWLAEDHAHA